MLDWMYSLERLRRDWTSGVVFHWPIVDQIPVGYMATRPTRTPRSCTYTSCTCCRSFRERALVADFLNMLSKRPLRPGVGLSDFM